MGNTSTIERTEAGKSLMDCINDNDIKSFKMQFKHHYGSLSAMMLFKMVELDRKEMVIYIFHTKFNDPMWKGLLSCTDENGLTVTESAKTKDMAWILFKFCDENAKFRLGNIIDICSLLENSTNDELLFHFKLNLLCNNLKRCGLILKSQNFNVNHAMKDGKTALHFACKHRKSEIVEMLINSQKNVDVNIKDKNGNTPLHLAVKSRNTRCTALLLDHPQIDVKIKSKHDYTPFELINSDGEELYSSDEEELYISDEEELYISEKEELYKVFIRRGFPIECIPPKYKEKLNHDISLFKYYSKLQKSN